MKKNIFQMLLLLMTVALTAACSSDSETTENAPAVINPDEALTPIRITANYAGDDVRSNATRVSYSEDGSDISATWQAGDKLKVVFNNRVSTLDLESGAGTASATFSGTISGTPSATSMLICYVSDQNNTSAVTINSDGSYTYTDGTFLAQDGTLGGAAKCNLYYGATFYGTGEDISCDFAVNTSMMKFTIFAPDGVSAGDEATLTYKSNGTAISKATFTVGTVGKNTIYLTIPAGQYTGEQTLVYNSGETEDSETLSATKANFVAGETYSKFIAYSDPGISIADLGTHSEYIGFVLAANGKAYTSVSAANTYSTASAMIAYLGNLNGDDGESAYSSTYNHGLAVALTDVTYDGREGSETTYMHWGTAVAAAAVYPRSRPEASSAWFLPTEYQWMRMLESCGGGTFTTSIYDMMPFSYGNFNTKLNDCGGTVTQNSRYWCNTQYQGEKWGYEFSSSSVAWFADNYFYARPAFAF